MSSDAVLVETRLRKLFIRIEANIFETMETIFLLTEVNRRILNSIPNRFDLFIDFIYFDHKNQNNQDHFIKQDGLRLFLPSEVLDGYTTIEKFQNNNNSDN